MKDARDPGTMKLDIGAKWPMMDGIEQAVIQLQAELGKKREEYNRISSRMAELKVLGLIYAGTHYKAGKYLYLVYPTSDDGSRERRYIGADPERIAKATAGIERGREYSALKVRVERMESEARQCYQNVHYAQVNIKG